MRERDGFSDSNADSQNMPIAKEGEAGPRWVVSWLERQNVGVNSNERSAFGVLAPAGCGNHRESFCSTVA